MREEEAGVAAGDDDAEKDALPRHSLLHLSIRGKQPMTMTKHLWQMTMTLDDGNLQFKIQHLNSQVTYTPF